jgi:hypothetical protein
VYDVSSSLVCGDWCRQVQLLMADRLWSMIKDTSGKTAMMFGEMPGQGVDLGDEVRKASDAVSAVIFGDAA